MLPLFMLEILLFNIFLYRGGKCCLVKLEKRVKIFVFFINVIIFVVNNKTNQYEKKVLPHDCCCPDDVVGNTVEGRFGN